MTVSLEQDDRMLIRWCVDQIRELHRKRPRQQPNMRDLQDVNGWGALNGHTLGYDQLTGRWKPMLSPPVVTFNMNGTLTVAATDEMPMGAAGRVVQAAARLKTAGTSTTTALLKHTTANGATTTTLATYTFTSGNKNPTSYPTISFPFALYDVLWLDVTGAGTAAAGLVVPVWATAGASP